MSSTIQSTSVSSRTYDRQKSSKRQKGRELIKLQIEKKDLTIDKDDYNVITALQSPRSWKPRDFFNEADWRFSLHIGKDNDILSKTVNTTGFQRGTMTFEFSLDNDEKRVSRLEIFGFNNCRSKVFNGFLPKEVFRLSALKVLILHDDFSISPSIGRLQNLEELFVGGSQSFSLGLPDEFSSLKKLERLDLEMAHIHSLPPLIGELKHLEEVNLSDNDLKELPEELGDLPALRILDLSVNCLRTLPPTIGKLKNLQELNLSQNSIQELPEEFWNLFTLRTLLLEDITYLSVASLLRRLQNLERFALILSDSGVFSNTNGQKIMQDIGTFSKLRRLELGFTTLVDRNPYVSLLPCIDTLVSFVHLEYLHLHYVWVSMQELELITKLANLKSLKFLYIFGSTRTLCSMYGHEINVESKLEDRFLLDLVQASPLLGEVDSELDKGRPKLTYALACNRFKCRNPFGSETEQAPPYIYKLWPKLLGKSRRLGRAGKMDNGIRAFGRIPGGRLYHREKAPTIEPHDALYTLLLHGRASFVQVLLHRSRSRRNNRRRRRNSNSNNH